MNLVETIVPVIKVAEFHALTGYQIETISAMFDEYVTELAAPIRHDSGDIDTEMVTELFDQMLTTYREAQPCS